ncbi:uncharacterized protein LOC118198266 [Stegodyphus dumicola]|uniref:uncharacterized protein LOC118198266 n=1 Tax=Stegodyphus dumicola TaxID=202533 RepID=UPI0015AE7446|nr:uncharacterized protein LOC118198266 [Stegodyphus dumicola]
MTKKIRVFLEIGYPQFIICLFFHGLLFADCIAGSNTDNLRINRQKRNIFCFWGLTGLIKQTLYNSLQDIHEHDPLDLGNAYGNKLRDGVLRGLSSLTNVTDLDVYCNSDTVIFATTLGMKDAEIRYKWRRKLLFSFMGSVWTKAKEVHFSIKVSLNTTRETRFAVTDIKVTKLEGFEFGFTGLGPLNHLLKSFVKVMYQVWTKRVIRIIQKLIKTAVESQLSKVTLPF